MAFTARVYNVLIASPGDTSALRDLVEASLYSWNRDRAEGAQVVLRPLRWEFDAVSAMGTDAQAAINQQLVAKSDILVGLFYSRLGSATARSASGTAEEIDEAAKAGKRVHVYFSEMPIPRDTKPEDLEALNKFKTEIQGKGLIGSFASPDDLVARVRTAIESDIEGLAGASIPGLAASVRGAALHASYESEREPKTDSKGKTTYHTRNERIEVHNTGNAMAEKVMLTMVSRDDNEAPDIYMGSGVLPSIPPHGHFDFRISTHMGTASIVDANLTWTEDGEEHQTTHTLSL
jgi:hypothetical protein